MRAPLEWLPSPLRPRRLWNGLLALVAAAAVLAHSAPLRALPTTAEPAPSVALVTIAPGTLYWERFGHNAILIQGGGPGGALLYNFGFFDFAQENFFGNFLRGRMLYRLVVTDPLTDFAAYQAAGRSVWVQELALQPAAAAALARDLAERALPENAEYRYDYYANNCSTRVRDALDFAVHGALRAQSIGRGRGETYRSLSLAYAAPEPWLALGIDLGLGPAADLPISFWEEAFLPMRLRDLVAELKQPEADGRVLPLVRSEYQAVVGRPWPGLPSTPYLALGFGFGGLMFAALVWFGLARPLRFGRRLAAGCAALSSLLIGLVGCGLIGLWCCTDHAIAWANANLVLFNPLALGLVLPLWRLGGNEPRACRPIASGMAALILIGVGLLLLAGAAKFSPQVQSHWFALLIPWHLMVWAALRAAWPLPTAAQPDLGKL